MATLTLPYTLSDPYTQADLAALTTFANGIYTGSSQYGSFFDLTSQTAAVANTAYNVAIGNQDGHNGISLSGVGRITFTQPGIYHISQGVQFANSDTAANDYVEYWWGTENTATYIVSLPTSVTPVAPATPSVSVDVIFAALL